MRQKQHKIHWLHREVDELVRTGAGNIFQLMRNLVHAVLHNLFAGTEAVVVGNLAWLPESDTSNPLSKLLRPAFQHKRIRALLGANLAGAMIVVGSVTVPAGAMETYPEAEISVLPENSIVITTEERFQNPVELLGVSQGYNSFHKGIDLRASLGSQVAPIAKGKVKEVIRDRFGYGLHVILEHEGGFSSLYAHLGKVMVKEGDELTIDSNIGTIGLTGWTTGPHLHLEVYQEGKLINPLWVVPVNQTRNS